jgi:hypothetical protein
LPGSGLEAPDRFDQLNLTAYSHSQKSCRGPPRGGRLPLSLPHLDRLAEDRAEWARSWAARAGAALRVRVERAGQLQITFFSQ